MSINDLVLKVNDVLTGSVLIIALVGIGLLFTFKLGFIQIRGFKDGWNRTFGGLFSKKGDAGKDGMSSFQALATAIAAQVGTGNIAGAATAIAVGGPGAIFWMWISAFLGMSTIFAEAVMAQKFKQVSDDGTVTGGPVYYIRGAFKGTFGKVLAAIFAVLIIFALGFMGNAVQSNSIAASWNTAFGIPKIAMGIFIAVVSLFVFTGGMKRIAKVTELIVPIMAAFYIVGSLIVIFANVTAIPAAFHDIIVGAFKPAAVAGGAMGATLKLAVQKGVARGLFSNEAGMGSAAITAAAATTDNPVRQGYINMTGTFWDTIVVCTITGLAIASSGVLGTTNAAGELLTGSDVTIAAFETVLGSAGGWLVTIGITLFAFSTILGWEYHGEKAFEYLFHSHKYNMIYRIIFSLVVYIGATTSLDLAWNFSDIANALMAIPNLICLLLLSKEIATDMQEFQKVLAEEKAAKKRA